MNKPQGSNELLRRHFIIKQNDWRIGECYSRTMFPAFINFKNRMRTFIIPTALCSAQHNIEETVSEEELPGFKANRNTSKKLTLFSEVGLSKTLQNESGWERLQMYYSYRNPTGFIQDEVQCMNTILRRTVIIGGIFTLLSNSTQVTSKLLESPPDNQTTRKSLLMERMLRRDVLKETFKTTARLTCFSFILMHLSQSIAVYRNKSSIWEYGIASAVAFGFKDLNLGMKGIVRSSGMGALIGVIGGYVMCNVLSNSGWAQEERNVPRRLNYLNAYKTENVDQTSSEFDN